MQWKEAREVADIADELIAAHHVDLQGFRIEYLFMDSTPMSGGGLVWGRARRVSGWPAYLEQFGAHGADDSFRPVEPFGVIEISWPVWCGLNKRQKRALVDHELCHFRPDFDEEPPVLKIRRHDIEEFIPVLRRHGLWSDASVAVAKEMAETFAASWDEVEAYANARNTNPADEVPPADEPEVEL